MTHAPAQPRPPTLSPAAPPPPGNRIALAPGAATHEVELKLALAPTAFKKLAALPWLARMAQGAPTRRRQLTVYYDTPDLALVRAGLALRLRHQGGRTLQTLKSMDSQAASGAAVRREWEWELPAPADGEQPRPDTDGMRAIPDLPALPADSLERVAPVFATDIKRTVLMLHPDPHTVVELAMDRGRVVVGTPGPGGAKAGTGETRALPVAEVELELVSGRIATLYALAAALHRHVPVRLSARSKADIGLDLVTGRPPRPVPVPPHALTPAISTADAVRHLMRLGLGGLIANADIVLEAGGGDGHKAGAPATHEMARAARRLRHTLRLFQHLTGNLEAGDLARRLKPLCHALEAAYRPTRLAAALARRLPDMGDKHRRKLEKTLDRDRDAARRALRRHLKHKDHTALVLDLAQWTEGGTWAEAGLNAPLRTALPPLLDHALLACRTAVEAQTRQRKDKGKGMSLGDLARLRRRGTRLAALADAAQGLYPPSGRKPAPAKNARKGGGPGDWLAVLDTARRAACDLSCLRDLATIAPRTPGLNAAMDALTAEVAAAWAPLATLPPFWRSPPPANRAG